MPNVRPPTFGDAPRIRIVNPLGEVLLDYFKQVLILMGYMRQYSEYEFLVEDYFAVELQCQFDQSVIVKVSLEANPQEVSLEVLDLDGQRIGPASRIRLANLYRSSAIKASRIFNQRLSAYLP